MESLESATNQPQGSAPFRRLSTRAGAARPLGLALVVVIALAALVGWWLTRSPIPAAGPAAEPPPPVEPPARLENPEVTRADSGLGEPGERPPAVYPAELDDPSRFDGRGKVEIHLKVTDGIELPERWTVTFSPSPARIGGDRAVGRRVEVTSGPVVEIDDVQLGAYSVRASAGDLESEPYDFELRKPDEVDLVFPLTLRERGFISGRVVDAKGVPVEGLPVFLLAQRSEFRREVKTDANGKYTFPKVPDGDYRVRVGSAETALAAVEDLSFVAPSAHLRDLSTPLMGTLNVRVVDENGVGLTGVKVQGLGLLSGAFELVTGPDGRASAGPCVGGDLRLYASDPTAGNGNAELHFHPDEGPGEIEIRLRR